MNSFNFIKSKLSILDVVQEYTSVKRAGNYWKGRCPLHDEKTASFTVTPHREIFYCFGCHQGGDVIEFIEKVEHCSSLEAADLLVERYKIELPKKFITQKENIEEKKVLQKIYYKVCALFASWCNRQLIENTGALEYLYNRGITLENIKLYQLGYCPSKHRSLIQFLKEASTHHILLKDFIDASIIFEGKQGLLHSPFEDRIIFPITHHQDTICGFGARIFKADDERSKYYNSHDNEFFTKGMLMYGFSQAKKNIQTTGEVCIVEGYIDCIAMSQAGRKNTIATLGTACSKETLKTLARYAQKIILVYDADTAGKKAATRLIDFSWELNRDLFIARLPDQEDPASYLQKHGPTSITTFIDNAQDAISWYINESKNNLEHVLISERVQMINDLIQLIIKVEDPFRKNLLIQKISQASSIPLQILEKKIYQGQKLPTDFKKETTVEQTTDLLEKQIFCAILTMSGKLDEHDLHFIISRLPLSLQDILKKLQEFKKSSVIENFSDFFCLLDQKEQEIVSKLMIQAPVIDENGFNQILEQFKKREWKILVKNVKIKLDQAQKTNDSKAIEKIIAEFQSSKQYMRRKGLL